MGECGCENIIVPIAVSVCPLGFRIHPNKQNCIGKVINKFQFKLQESSEKVGVVYGCENIKVPIDVSVCPVGFRIYPNKGICSSKDNSLSSGIYASSNQVKLYWGGNQV